MANYDGYNQWNNNPQQSLNFDVPEQFGNELYVICRINSLDKCS